MKVKINRLDPTVPLPVYQTGGAAAFDLAAREQVVIPAKSLARVSTGLIIATPEGHALIISARSSLAAKKGLLLGNGIGVVDSDYRGPADEILISVYNLTDYEVVVAKGDRIAQGMFIKVERAEWSEENIQAASRGGFGSTG